MRSGSGSSTSRTMRQHLLAALARQTSWVCSRSTSSIWSPQVITGFSAVIGSWKIIDMRVARSSRSRDGAAHA